MHRWLRKLGRLRGECKRGLAQRRSAFETLEDRCLLAGNFTEFLIPTAAPESPFGINTGSDGNLWFTEQDPKGASDSIGRITTAGTAQLFKVPTSASLPGAITAGPDGALWFVEVQAGQIGRSATDGTMSEFALAKGSSPQDITVGPNGNLWFTNASLNQIGQITTN